MKRRPIPQSTLRELAERSDCTKGGNNRVSCEYCGADGWVEWEGPTPSGWIRLVEITVDHVVPVTRGGTEDLANLVWACRSCNSSKGDMPLAEWPGYRVPRRVDNRIVHPHVQVSNLQAVAGFFPGQTLGHQTDPLLRGVGVSGQKCPGGHDA